MDFEVFIGWDPRLALQWNVCARSLVATAAVPPAIQPIGMRSLERVGWYKRPTEQRVNETKPRSELVDKISGAPMSTEFALARFYVPFLARSEWAVYVDSDFLFRDDIEQLLELADPGFAVQVVQHAHAPAEKTKMDGQQQSAYPRKNWSSLILWNMNHAGCMTGRFNQLDCNTKPGLWLQQFGWLREGEIGALPRQWNWIEGASPARHLLEPSAVHFTAGTPDMDGHENAAYADEWLRYLTMNEVDADMLSTPLPCKPAASIAA